MVYLPRALYRRYWNDDAIDALSLHLKGGASVSALQSEIQKKFAARYQLTLLPNAEVRRSVFETFDNTFAVTYALQLIAVLVAGIGIFDTFLSLILERRREVAALRALALRRDRFPKQL